MMKQYDIEMRYPPQGVATDTTMLFDILQELDIELLGVQEIVDPILFGEMAKRHLGEQFQFIYAPFEGWQKVGFLFDTSRLQLTGEPVTYRSVSLDRPDRLRPAFGAYFKTIPDGFDFHALVVHLKSSPRGAGEREKQWQALEDILRQLPADEWRDQDIILLGDFNNVSKERENEFLPVLEQVDFRWLGNEDTTLISSYWRPDWQKEELQSSKIDQIVISSDATEEYIKPSLKVGGFCSGAATTISGVFPDYYLKISDHCPVFVSFRPFPDND
jgi:endonuclease/exonuclease/phosphatase family metal-dependent hydrolase